MKIVRSWLLVLIWMALIFYMSSRTGSESSAMSGWVSDLIYPIFSFIDQDVFITLIRKSAHITEYFILTILVYHAIRQTVQNHVLLYSILFSFFYAVSDEIHQLFVQNRGPSVIDVGIDGIGIMLFIVIWRIWYEKKKI